MTISRQPARKYTTAIVRTPCKNIVKGITTTISEQPNYERALEQHKKYISALESCGIKVIILYADEQYPDSTFVEDTAILTPYCAILSNPAKNPRKGEVEINREVISEFYDNIETIKSPGTLEGGDVLMVEDTCYIGLSGRTNAEGAKQLIGILQNYGMNGICIRVPEMLHLKTGLSFIGKNTLLMTHDFHFEKKFEIFENIEVTNDETYAANSLWINNKLLVPEGCPNTKLQLEAAGYTTISVDVSEFKKVNGGLSCLSLLF